MLRSRATEIRELVRSLGSRNATRVDAARARLSILGARAVEDLLEALEGDDNTIRARVMPLLALIQDPRGREPLAAMLLDRNPRLRQVAAQCLGRFNSPEVVAALNRFLGRERCEGPRIAAVQALVEQYAAGQEGAILKVLELMADPAELPAARLAALALLAQLPASERNGLLGRLKQDPCSQMRKRIEEIEAGGGDGAPPGATELRVLVADLGSDDYARWNEVVHRLAACGAPAIRPVLEEMQSRAHDPEYCKRAGMVLRAMGPRRGRELATGLEVIDEPVPLAVLVEVIGALGEKSLIYRLKELIDRLAQSTVGGEIYASDLMQRVRAKAHLELARIGSRVAIQDLREALADPDRRLELEMLAAVELIGTREEIGTLLLSYGREDAFIQERIGGVVRTIMKRERIRRNDKMLRAFGRAQGKALAAILPPAPARRPGRGPNP